MVLIASLAKVSSSYNGAISIGLSLSGASISADCFRHCIVSVMSFECGS